MGFIFKTTGLIFLALFQFATIAPAFADDAQVDDEEESSKIPFTKPNWGLAFRGGWDSMPIDKVSGDIYELAVDWVVPFQMLGVFSVGVDFGAFPLKRNGLHILPSPLSHPMAGVQARYQLKYFDGQFLVPTAAVAANYFRWERSNQNAATVNGSIYQLSAGVMLELGFLDKKTARNSYDEMGMARSYLTFEVCVASVNTSIFKDTVDMFLIGVRTEFASTSKEE